VLIKNTQPSFNDDVSKNCTNVLDAMLSNEAWNVRYCLVASSKYFN